MKYIKPSWIDEFVTDQVLSSLSNLDDNSRKIALYSVGREKLENVQSIFLSQIPPQDDTGRYITAKSRMVFPDQLMEDIHTAQRIQEDKTRHKLGRPQYPFRFVPVWTPRQMEDRIRSRDWSNVWSAGSHTSCDIYVLYMNIMMGLDEYRPAFEAAMSVCAALQNAGDGMWGLPSTEPYIRVNGTMKILSRIHFVQECHLPFADKVIDYTLKIAEDFISGKFKMCSVDISTYICSQIDIIFCLLYSVKMTQHRNDDIKQVAYAMLDLLNIARTITGCPIGLVQGIINRISILCGFSEELNWPIKIYRFPD